MAKPDVAVVGAGAFGAWTAWHLRQAGLNVLLVDAYGPANSRASSGGESRIIRMGYGPREIYTRWSVRSLKLWREILVPADPSLFINCGALWLAHQDDPFGHQSLAALEQHGVPHERLDARQIRSRFPQFTPADDTIAIHEPQAGGLLARRAIQTLVRLLTTAGVRYEQRHVTPGDLDAAHVVYACGPWLGKIFPQLLASRILPTRQDVLFFGTPPGSTLFGHGQMPCWIDVQSQFYGFPDLESRGFKIADDKRGQVIDPDTTERIVSPASIEQARAYLRQRIPAMADAPLLETRVCQYENTANGDYLLDRHPELDRTWLAGGGSGHGFKHGPAVGEYMAGLILGTAEAEPRFSFQSKPECLNGPAASSM